MVMPKGGGVGAGLRLSPSSAFTVGKGCQVDGHQSSPCGMRLHRVCCTHQKTTPQGLTKDKSLFLC